jgi:hypothetical protein
LQHLSFVIRKEGGKGRGGKRGREGKEGKKKANMLSWLQN